MPTGLQECGRCLEGISVRPDNSEGLFKNFEFTMIPTFQKCLGTLGQLKPWPNLKWGVNPESINPSSAFRVPPDLKRTASYTSLKVFQNAPPIATKKYVVEVDLSITEQEKKKGVYGKRLKPPFLGNFHSFSEKTYKVEQTPVVDESMMNIPVFVYLKMSPWEPIPQFPVPKCIVARRKSITPGVSLETEDFEKN